MKTNANIKIELKAFTFGDFGINIKAYCKIKGDVHKPTIARSITECLSRSYNNIGFSLISHSIAELKHSRYSIEVHLRNNGEGEYKTADFTEWLKNATNRKVRVIVKSDQKEMTGDVSYIIKERLENLKINEKA